MKINILWEVFNVVLLGFEKKLFNLKIIFYFFVGNIWVCDVVIDGIIFLEILFFVVLIIVGKGVIFGVFVMGFEIEMFNEYDGFFCEDERM